MRFWALLDALASEALQAWISQDPHDPNRVEAHPAVFAMAATMRLDPRACFNLDVFVETLQKITGIESLASRRLGPAL